MPCRNQVPAGHWMSPASVVAPRRMQAVAESWGQLGAPAPAPWDPAGPGAGSAHPDAKGLVVRPAAPGLAEHLVSAVALAVLAGREYSDHPASEHLIRVSDSLEPAFRRIGSTIQRRIVSALQRHSGIAKPRHGVVASNRKASLGSTAPPPIAPISPLVSQAAVRQRSRPTAACARLVSR